MVSLRAVLIDCGVLSRFEETMDELEVPDRDIKTLQYQIGQLVLAALVKAGSRLLTTLRFN